LPSCNHWHRTSIATTPNYCSGQQTHDTDDDTAEYITDERAMILIQGIMSGNEWSADTLDAIADIVRLTGREVLNSDGVVLINERERILADGGNVQCMKCLAIGDGRSFSPPYEICDSCAEGLDPCHYL
jgi:hypothetical protein